MLFFMFDTATVLIAFPLTLFADLSIGVRHSLVFIVKSLRHSWPKDTFHNTDEVYSSVYELLIEKRRIIFIYVAGNFKV